MAQPAAVAPAPELTFGSEEERDAALEALQNRDSELTAADLAEIERIESAKIVAGKPAAQPQQQVSAQEPASLQAQQQADAQPAPAQEQPRQWQITEDMIAQFDEEYEEHKRDGTARRRKTITQRTPEDLLKTMVHGQRRIRYLEETKLPEAHNEGYQRARDELTPQLTKLQKELEEARAKLQAAPQPVQQAAQGQQQAQPQSNVDAARKTLVETVKSLEGVSDDDLVDHVPKLAGGLKSAVAVIEEQSARLQQMNSVIEDLKAGKLSVQAAQQQVAQPAAQQPQSSQQQDDATRRWLEACKKVDGFVGSPACPTDLKVDQGFDEMTAEAVSFHQELGQHYTGKPAHQLTADDLKDAVAAYLAESPQLIQRVNAAGAREPRNYRKWVALDQIDALRNGYYRDPRTKVWRTRHSEDTGRPVQFPDMQSAYNEYLRITGQDKAVVAKAVQDNTRQLVDAMTRRDNGLVQMDERQSAQSAVALEQAEQQAQEFLETHDFEEVRKLARRGNRAPWDQYNAALKVLGQPPLPDSMI